MHQEEIKKKKAVIINAITEISKALEGTKSKISETEKELTYVQSASWKKLGRKKDTLESSCQEKYQ